MKKIILLVIILMLTVVGCSGEPTEDLSDLPYYSYLNDDNPVVTINIKDRGKIRIQLFPEVAENTVNNFIKYIEDGDYENSSFHRVIEDFMIQGGKVDNPNCPIRGEFASNGYDNNLSHYRGVISMARTHIKNSATSQFFIVHKNTFSLDGNYASFGGLISGFDILDDLAKVKTNLSEAPIEDIIIESITVDLNTYTYKRVNCAY